LARETLDDLGIEGVVLAGDGVAPVAPVPYLGIRFYPDMTLHHYGEPVLAIEVKYLKQGQPQGSLATALGQASVYRQRFPQVAVFLVDMSARIDAVSTTRELMDSSVWIVTRSRVLGDFRLEADDRWIP
jgi:hypothetical protein